MVARAQRMFKGILKNTTYLLVSEMIGRVTSLVQVPILVRYLGKSEFGILSLAGALPGALLFVIDLGLHSYIIREISQDRRKLQACVENIFVVKSFLSAIFLSVVLVIARILAYSEDVEFCILVLTLSFALGSMQGLFSCILRGTQNFLYDGLLQTVNMVGLFLGVLFVVFLDRGLLGLVYSQLIVQLTVLLICIGIYVRKYGVSYGLFSRVGQWSLILRNSAPFALIAIVLPIYYQVNIIFLSKLSGYEATGIFAAAYKIILMIDIIGRQFAQVLYPTLANLFVTSEEEFRRIYYYSCRAIALALFPITFGLVVLADRIVIILFKHEFADAIPAVQIMGFSLLFSSLMNILTASLNAGKEEKKVALVLVVATFVNILINLVLIPKYSYIGASISTVASEMLRFAGSYYYFRNRFFKTYLVGRIGKIILACLSMSLLVIWFKEGVSLGVLIGIGGASYLMFVGLFGAVSNEEIRKIFTLFRKATLVADGARLYKVH